jgi:hypothetical protein
VTDAGDGICDPVLARQMDEPLGINVSMSHNEGYELASSSLECELQRFLSEGGNQ